MVKSFLPLSLSSFALTLTLTLTLTPILNLQPTQPFPHNPKTRSRIQDRSAMAIDAVTTPTTAHNAIATLISLSKISDTNKLSLTKPPTIYDSMMQESIENARILISKWDPTSPSLQKLTSLFQENPSEAEEFVTAVEGLRRAMHFLITHRPCSDQLVAANGLMKTAMLRLEKEFYYILSANRDCLSPESVSAGSSGLSRSLSFSNSEEEENEERVAVAAAAAGDEALRVERALSQMKMIAESMVSSGYSKECGKIYRITRKSIVDEEMYRLGVRRYSPSQIMRLDHESLRNQVNRWIQAAKTAVRSIFRGEKLMCDYVFAFSETIKQTCIAHTTVEGAVNLLRFPEIVAKGKRSPEKIALLMSLYETISDLWPEIEAIFSCETLSPVKSQAMTSIQKLRESAQTILSEFVSSIQKNSLKTPLPGGGVHPLTYRVMDYVVLLAENAGTLSDILPDAADNNNNSPFPESYFDIHHDSGVASQLAWIVLVLLCKLDSKAELYKDIALSYLFLANNLQFIVDRVGATALRLLLGEIWLSKLREKVKLYAANYESVAWAKVLACLPAETESSPAAIKEHFRKFNSAFEAAYRKQSAWIVSDPKLRDEIKVSIARKVVPAYRRFYESCYVAIVSEERNLEVLVRFSPDNLGNYLSDLFLNTGEISKDSSSSSSSSSSPPLPLPLLAPSQSKLVRCF